MPKCLIAASVRNFKSFPNPASSCTPDRRLSTSDATSVVSDFFLPLQSSFVRQIKDRIASVGGVALVWIFHLVDVIAARRRLRGYYKRPRDETRHRFLDVSRRQFAAAGAFD